MGQIKNGGISFSTGNYKQTWAQAIDIGRPNTRTSHLATNLRIRVEEGENAGESFWLDSESRASRRAYPLGFHARNLVRLFLRAEQQGGTNDSSLPCISKLIKGRCIIEMLIIRLGIGTIQEWAMAEEGYLGCVIIRPIDEIWITGIDQGPIAIIWNREFIRDIEEQAEGIASCHSSDERFGSGMIGNLSKDMQVEFEVEGYWAYCCMRLRGKIGCEALHEELWRWRALDQQNRTTEEKELTTIHSMSLIFTTWSESSLSASLKPNVTNILVTIFVGSKPSNDAGIFYSLMRKEGNFSIPSAFKVFLESTVNLSQYSGVLNTCIWVDEVIHVVVTLGGLIKGLELMNQMRNCRLSPNGFVYNVLIGRLCGEKRVDDARILIEEMLKRVVQLRLEFETNNFDPSGKNGAGGVRGANKIWDRGKDVANSFETGKGSSFLIISGRKIDANKKWDRGKEVPSSAEDTIAEEGSHMMKKGSRSLYKVSTLPGPQLAYLVLAIVVFEKSCIEVEVQAASKRFSNWNH